jgi:hypothetical protein
MGNTGRHFHECPDCGFEAECGLEGWTEYCSWHDLEPQEQSCMDCDPVIAGAKDYLRMKGE